MFRFAKVFFFNVALKQNFFFLLTSVYMLLIFSGCLKLSSIETSTLSIAQKRKGHLQVAFPYVLNNKILVFPHVVFHQEEVVLYSFAFPDSFETYKVIGDKTVVVVVGFGNYET